MKCPPLSVAKPGSWLGCLLVAVGFCGCGLDEVRQGYLETPDCTATLQVHRGAYRFSDPQTSYYDQSSYSHFSVQAGVAIDSLPAAALSEDESATIHITPGDHRISTAGDRGGTGVLDLEDVQDGELISLEVAPSGYRATGRPNDHPWFSVVLKHRSIGPRSPEERRRRSNSEPTPTQPEGPARPIPVEARQPLHLTAPLSSNATVQEAGSTITVSNPGPDILLAANHADYGPCIVEAEVRATAGPASLGNGLWVRGNANGDCILFNVTADGRLAMYSYEHGSYRSLSGLGPDKVAKFRHPAAQPAAANRLRIETQGDWCAFYLNEQLVGRCACPPRTGGQVGVYVSGGNTVEFSGLAGTAAR